MNNSEFQTAKLRLEMSGLGDKTKTILNFNNVVESPSSQSLATFHDFIEALTDGNIETKQYIATSQLD